MQLNEETLKKIIYEELTKQEVKSLINSRLDGFMRERELKKLIRDITVDVLDDFFRELWQKKSFWKSTLKNK